MNSKTQGIVIKRQDFSEADQILTIFTERFGKVKAMARGIRRLHSHLAGALEPFILTNLQLYEGRTFYTVTGAAIEEEFGHLHEDLAKMASAFYLGELIDKFEKEEQRSEAVFNLLAQVMTCLDNVSGSKDIKLLLRSFEIRLLKSNGFLGDLAVCIHCHQKLEPITNYWDGEEGGIICGVCQKLFHHGRLVSNDLIKIFRLFEGIDLNLIGHLNITSQLEKESESVLSVYLKNILESEIKSERFLKNIQPINNL